MFCFLFVFVLHKVNFTNVHSYKILCHIRSYVYARPDEGFLPLAGSYPDYVFMYISHSVCVEKVFVRRFLSSPAKPNIRTTGVKKKIIFYMTFCYSEVCRFWCRIIFSIWRIFPAVSSLLFLYLSQEMKREKFKREKTQKFLLLIRKFHGFSYKRRWILTNNLTETESQQISW